MLRYAMLIAAALSLSIGIGKASARDADLADRIAGTYEGNVMPDARGEASSKVVITVTRVGPDQVEIRSDYPYIPKVTITLQKALDAIVSTSGPHVLLLDTIRGPNRLDLTINDASWSGLRVEG